MRMIRHPGLPPRPADGPETVRREGWQRAEGWNSGCAPAARGPQDPSREETPAVVDVAFPSAHETPGAWPLWAHRSSHEILMHGVSPLLRRSQGTRMAAGSCKWRGSPWGLNWLRSCSREPRARTG
ncbi:uncharacterized protein LOC107000333 [Macaca mulatta]